MECSKAELDLWEDEYENADEDDDIDENDDYDDNEDNKLDIGAGEEEEESWKCIMLHRAKLYLWLWLIM